MKICVLYKDLPIVAFLRFVGFLLVPTLVAQNPLTVSTLITQLWQLSQVNVEGSALSHLQSLKLLYIDLFEKHTQFLLVWSQRQNWTFNTIVFSFRNMWVSTEAGPEHLWTNIHKGHMSLKHSLTQINSSCDNGREDRTSDPGRKFLHLIPVFYQ